MEDSFTFLNRVSTRYWSRIRDELEHWFHAYPREHATNLRARFRHRKSAEHFGAWWELYLHRLFTRLDWRVEVEPVVEHGASRPDFLLTRPGESIYVEAAVVFTGIQDATRHAAREGWTMDVVNEVRSAEFFVGLEFDCVGARMPKKRDIQEPLAGWLSRLDRNEVLATRAAGGDPPKRVVAVNDWKMTFEAFVRTDSRSTGRLLGIGPSIAGWVNDRDKLLRTLRQKSRQHRVSEPYVIAALCVSGGVDFSEIEQALFGRHAVQYALHQRGNETMIRRRDGLFMSRNGPRATRVSGVITGIGLLPWACATSAPHYWRNPWARKPLASVFPFSESTATDRGEVTYLDRAFDPAATLGLPTAWPGPEAPFPGDE